MRTRCQLTRPRPSMRASRTLTTTRCAVRRLLLLLDLSESNRKLAVRMRPVATTSRSHSIHRLRWASRETFSSMQSMKSAAASRKRIVQRARYSTTQLGPRNPTGTSGRLIICPRLAVSLAVPPPKTTRMCR